MATATHRAATEPRCRNCETIAARVDQAGWCEQCVVDLGTEAGLLYNTEELILEWLQRGYQPEHLRSAVEMSLAQASGTTRGRCSHARWLTFHPSAGIGRSRNRRSTAPDPQETRSASCGTRWG
jgi:hypothetical protein